MLAAENSMSQDTRKDPRTKVVSLNVRYKSATVDEFIENHSYDVSQGRRLHQDATRPSRPAPC